MRDSETVARCRGTTRKIQGGKGERLACTRVGPREPLRVDSHILRVGHRRLAGLLHESEGGLEVRGARTGNAVVAVGACSIGCAGEVGEVQRVETIARRTSAGDGYGNWHAKTAVHIHSIRVSPSAHHDFVDFDERVLKQPLFVRTTLNIYCHFYSTFPQLHFALDLRHS